MFLTVHSTFALALSQHLPNPLLAFSVGVLSHFVLDAIPHGDEGFFDRWFGQTKIKVMAGFAAADTLIMIIWLAILFKHGEFIYFNSAIWAVLGSVLPDAFLGGYFLLRIMRQGWLEKFFNFHGAWLHQLIKKRPRTAVLGFTIQGLVLILLAGYLLYF